MRIFTAFAATIVLAGISVAAQGGALYVKHTESTVLVTGADGHHAKLNAGYNTLGEQHQMGCENKDGCLVTYESMVEIFNVSSTWAICTRVDGELVAHCPGQSPTVGEGGAGNAIGSVLLSPGKHMIETDVLDNAGGAELGIWEVHYTMLLDPPHGHLN